MTSLESSLAPLEVEKDMRLLKLSMMCNLYNKHFRKLEIQWKGDFGLGIQNNVD